MKMLSSPTRSRISILAPSSVPMVSAPFSASFMLPVPDASMPAVEICSDKSAGRNDRLRQADIVVRDEHDLQQAVHRRVAVDHERHIVDQLDDQFRAVIAGGGLAGEDLDPRHPIGHRPRAHLVVQRDRLQDIQQLPLVLVNALDVHVEQRVAGRARCCIRSATSFASACLLARRIRVKPFMHGRDRPRRARNRPARPRRPARAAPTTSVSKRVSSWVGGEQPAAEGDAVGLVDDAVRDKAGAARETRSSRISSVCSSETPFTLCEPRNASELIRTRRPALSSISESAASGGPSVRGSAQTASRCSRLI